MAGFTYTGATEPTLNDLPVAVSISAVPGFNAVLTCTAIAPLNTFYSLVVKAAVGNKVYTKPYGDDTLTLTFTVDGTYDVILMAIGYKPKKITVKRGA